MRVCLLTTGVPPDDPSIPVRAHAQGLAARGHDVVVAVTGGGAVAPGAVGGARLMAVADARATPFDVAVATCWESCAHLFDLRADRHAYRVDGFAHERLGVWQPERIAAALTYDLPLDFLAAAAWIAERLAELRPEARVELVPDGLAHDAFSVARANAAPGAPLRILVDDRFTSEGRPSAAAALLEAMARPHTVAQLAAGQDAAARAAAYTRADVLVMLDPAGGAEGTPREAMRAGVVPVVMPAGGHDEVLRHQVDGLVAIPDDPHGTARMIDVLAEDRARLAALGAAAQATAAAWPSPDEAARTLGDALARLRAEPMPPDAAWPHRLMGDALAAVAIWRIEYHKLAAELRRAESSRADGTGTRPRAPWRSQRSLAPIRRVLAPLVDRARRADAR